MYIRLGNTEINYNKEVSSDYLTLAAVIDSGVSYEKPVIVRTQEELVLWFGSEFPEYDYFCEILKNGISLVLASPVPDKFIEVPGYARTKISGITSTDFNHYLESDGLDLFRLVSEGNNYWKLLESGKVVEAVQDPSKIALPVEFLDEIDEDTYDVFKGLRISFIDDPEIVEKTISPIVINLPGGMVRETLTLIDFDETPDYQESLSSYSPPPRGINVYVPGSKVSCSSLMEVEQVKEWPKLEINETNNNLIVSPEKDKDLISERSVYKVDYSKVPNSVYQSSINPDTGEPWYVAFYLVRNTGLDVPIVATDSSHSLKKRIDDEAKVYYPDQRTRDVDLGAMDKNIWDWRSGLSTQRKIQILLETPTSSKGSKINVVKGEGRFYYVYQSKYPRAMYSVITNIPGLIITPDPDKSKALVASWPESGIPGPEKSLLIESKLRGREKYWPSPIKVRLENPGPWKITISRGTYTEVFTGQWVGPDSIQYQVSSRSKLVRIDYLGVEPECGEWEIPMIPEEGSVSYLNALREISEYTWPIDFIMIPRPDDYRYNYQDILSLAKSMDTQVLIQNKDAGRDIVEVDKLPGVLDPGVIYRIGPDHFDGKDGNHMYLPSPEIEAIESGTGKDYMKNYLNDPENRLIYFYKGMKLSGKDRPGWYLFLEGLFSGNYGPRGGSRVTYDPPVDPISGNVYSKESGRKVKELRKYKSNYLLDNNGFYYYPEYLNGEVHEYTIWMRFVASKINRELARSKWDLVTGRNEAETIGKIQRVLEKVTHSFGLVRSIEIDFYSYFQAEGKLILSLNTYMSSPSEADMVIDILINYNN